GPSGTRNHALAADRRVCRSASRRRQGHEGRRGDERRRRGRWGTARERDCADARRRRYGDRAASRRRATQNGQREVRITIRNIVATGTSPPDPLTVCSTEKLPSTSELT